MRGYKVTAKLLSNGVIVGYRLADESGGIKNVRKGNIYKYIGVIDGAYLRRDGYLGLRKGKMGDVKSVSVSVGVGALKLTKVVRQGFLKYKVAENEYIVIGRIKKEIDDDLRISYVFDLDKGKIDSLVNYGEVVNDNVVTAIPLEKGYYQRFYHLPYFIMMRIPDRRRPDIREILDRLGLQYYDSFEVMLKLRGKHVGKFEVHETED